MGITLFPCSALEVITLHDSNLDVVPSPYSASNIALPPYTASDIAQHWTSLHSFALPWMSFPILALLQTLILPLASLGMLLHPLTTLLPLALSHFSQSASFPLWLHGWWHSCLWFCRARHSFLWLNGWCHIPLRLCLNFNPAWALLWLSFWSRALLRRLHHPQLYEENHFHHWHCCVWHSNQLSRNPLIAKVGTLGAVA